MDVGPSLPRRSSVITSYSIHYTKLYEIDAVGPLAGLLAEFLGALLDLLARLSGDGAGYLPLPPAGTMAPILSVVGAGWGTASLARRGIV